MERSLNLDLLSRAIGDKTGLPSPSELAQFLADAETQLLVGSPKIDPRLVQSGWYLHAIASSRTAPDIYGLPRQRAAYQVAAHIFDLALQSDDLDRVSRLSYCFAAQVAYLKSSLDPNARAVYVREITRRPLTLVENLDEVALSLGVAILGLDTRYIYTIGRELLRTTEALTEAWGTEVRQTPFGAAAQVADGVWDLLGFLTSGRQASLESGKASFLSAINNEFAAGDKSSRWVAAHLFDLCDGLSSSSIWTALPPDYPIDGRRSFVLTNPRILTLWPPQVDIFRPGPGQAHPLGPDVRRSLIATPTSGGKSLLGQILVIGHLASSTSGVCYVAPTRSLCNEIRNSLAQRVRFVRKQIGSDLPETVDFEEALGGRPDVEIMTPERLAFLVRTDTAGLLARFGLFIFDEVHNVGDRGRGWTYETSISYLHHLTKGTNHRLVLMSAVVGNKHHFVEWMGDDEKLSVRSSDWRGPRRLLCIWTTEPDWDTEVSSNRKSQDFPKLYTYDLRGVLHTRISATGAVQAFSFTEAVGTLALKGGRAGSKIRESTKSTPFYHTLVPLIKHLGSSGPVLIVESTRVETVRMASAIARAQDDRERPQLTDLIDLVVARLDADHPLVSVLRRGVGYHHGSLPNEIRAALELAVLESELHFLVATTTMTEGVNLPVRSVVIASQGSHGPAGYTEYISGAKLVNAIGRAGRAARETEGIVVLARNSGFTAVDFQKLDPETANTTITASLVTEVALQELAALENQLRESADAILIAAGETVSGFVSFVWFVASQREKLGLELTPEELQNTLANTLSWVQMPPLLRERWLRVARASMAAYTRSSPSSRQRWATSGMSLRSGVVLEALADEVAFQWESMNAFSAAALIIESILSSQRVQRLLDISEAPKTRVFSTRGGSRNEIQISIASMLRDWVNGAELQTLAIEYFSDVSDTEFRFEQLGDYISDYFENFFPWSLSVILSWANSKLTERNFSGLLIQTDLPAYIRYGVNNPTALSLVARGIRSRGLAQRIAAEWTSAAGFSDVQQWLGSLDMPEWQARFAPSVPELRNLVDFARAGGSFVRRLLDGEPALIPMHPTAEARGHKPSFSTLSESPVTPIEIVAGGERVGAISSGHQADLHGLLSMGFSIVVQWVGEGDETQLELRLVEPTSLY